MATLTITIGLGIEAREVAKKGRVLNTRPESEWLDMIGL